MKTSHIFSEELAFGRVLVAYAVCVAIAFGVLGCSASDAGSQPGVPDASADIASRLDADGGREDATRADRGIDHQVQVASEGGLDSGSDVIDSSIDGSPECGNQLVEPGEECDDGNLEDGDGCQADCRIESTGSDDVCPGKVITLTGTGTEQRKGSDTASTHAVLNQYGSGCGGSGKDLVYVITPDVKGLATVTLNSDFDAVLHARSTCGDRESELACIDQSGLAGEEKLSFPVAANVPAFIFVDGYAGSDGAFTIDVIIDTAYCGNGAAEPPEQCDDGNGAPGDGCSSICELEPGGIVDDCPGAALVLSGAAGATRNLSLTGSTKGKNTSQTPTSCSGSAPNDVYGITTDIAGSMKVLLVPAYDNATLHVRSECDTSSMQLDCIEGTEPFQPLTLDVPVLPNQTYFIIVDGLSSTLTSYNFGPYKLDVTVTPAACGNDILDGGEQCDDGNASSGDGCNPSCGLEPPTSGNDVCSGAPLALTPSGDDRTAVITATTATLNANYVSSLSPCSGATGKDAVYSIQPDIDGTLIATVVGAFDSAVYVRTACVTATDAGTADLACGEKYDGNSGETVSTAVEANKTYWVFVDSMVLAQAGVFELQILVEKAVCGNGRLDGGETCDDANLTPGDGCSETCKLEPAGPHDRCPGEILTLSAQTDGSTSTSTSTSTSVTNGIVNLANDFTHNGCTGIGKDAVYAVTPDSDGVVTATLVDSKFNAMLAARKVCDDKTTQITCANATTGNGGESIAFAVQAGQPYFILVDSVSSTTVGTFTLEVKLTAPYCGDGLVAGSEQCDDANTDSGDGCDSACQLEAVTGYDVCPGKPIALKPAGAGARAGVFTGTTEPLIANTSGTCGGASREAVFVVTSDIAGKLKAELSPAYKAVLYARETCGDASSELRCDYVAVLATGAYDITFPVLANIPYYLFVDGYSGAYGAFTLEVSIEP